MDIERGKQILKHCGHEFHWQAVSGKTIQYQLKEIKAIYLQFYYRFRKLKIKEILQSRQVKCTCPPKILLNNIDYLKNESFSHSHNWCQIQNIGISMRTSLYLVRLKICEWIKLLPRHLHQIQGDWAGRNFITASCVNSWLIVHPRMQRWIWNLQLPTDSTFDL